VTIGGRRTGAHLRYRQAMHFAPREHDVEGGGIDVGDVAAGDFLTNRGQRLHKRRATVSSLP